MLLLWISSFKAKVGRRAHPRIPFVLKTRGRPDRPCIPVTYWVTLTWKAVFGDCVFYQRLGEYVEGLQRKNPFTPQVMQMVFQLMLSDS